MDTITLAFNIDGHKLTVNTDISYEDWNDMADEDREEIASEIYNSQIVWDWDVVH